MRYNLEDNLGDNPYASPGIYTNDSEKERAGYFNNKVIVIFGLFWASDCYGVMLESHGGFYNCLDDISKLLGG